MRGVGHALIDAAEQGDPAHVRGALERGVRVNGRRADGETALAAAAHYGHTAVVEMLLVAGADPCLPGAKHTNPLVDAGVNDHRETAVALGRAMRGCADREWLHGALSQAADGYPAWVLGLPAAGADPNGIPLIMAIQCDELEIVEAMIAAGADVNRPYQDTTPLVRAVEARCPDIVEALIRGGAGVNQRAPKGVTPLMAARLVGRRGVDPSDSERIVELLICHGAGAE